MASDGSELRQAALRKWAVSELDRSDPELLDLSSAELMAAVLFESIEVITHFLGQDWLDRELHPQATKHGGILGLDQSGTEIDVLAAMRLYELADELISNQGVKGFDTFACGVRRRTLHAVTAELRAVRHSANAGQDVWFVDPDASDGAAPEAVVVLSGIEVPVEVKAREPRPLDEYSSRKIVSTLKAAAKKFAEQGPGLIYLRVDPPWSQDEAVLASINETCELFLRSHRRVSAIVLLVERHFPHADDSGIAIQTAQVTIPNQQPYIWIPDIQAWLR